MTEPQESATTRPVTGGCLCGKIRLSVPQQPLRVGLCHCLHCRKHHGAPFFAAAVFARGDVQISGKTRHYQNRHFCGTCGSSVFAVSGVEIEVHLGAFDQPNAFAPSYELWTDRRESWLPTLSRVRQYPRNRNTA